MAIRARSSSRARARSATRIPGFPTHSYLTFALAIPFMQGALFSVMNAGTDLARDIETGFLNRLALTPLRGPALLAGLLAGAVMVAIVDRPPANAVKKNSGNTIEGTRKAGLVR